MGDPLGDVDKCLRQLERYAEVGIHVADFVPTGDPVAFVERLGKEIIPRVVDLGSAVP